MPKRELTLFHEPDAEHSDLDRITEGVFEAHCAHVADDRREPLPIMLRDESGELCGGAVARLVFGDLHVDNIWVSPDARRTGQGGRILREAERLARERGAAWAFANTILPASREFFLANGYSVFGEVSGMPPGQTLSFLRKNLRKDGTGQHA